MDSREAANGLLVIRLEDKEGVRDDGSDWMERMKKFNKRRQD